VGIEEVVMGEPDLVQNQLEQMMHVVQACKEEKKVIKHEFLLVKSHLAILETRIRTEKARLEAEVSGVGGQMTIQQAIIDEVRVGITVL